MRLWITQFIEWLKADDARRIAFFAIAAGVVVCLVTMLVSLVVARLAEPTSSLTAVHITLSAPVTSTVTAQPEASVTPSPVRATATARPSPSSAVAERIHIRLSLFTESGQQFMGTRVPADERTTFRVVAEVSAPSELNMEGLLIAFGVEGGGKINPTEGIIHNGQAETVYTTGALQAPLPVTLAAFVDLPSIGRIVGKSQLTLVRQELSLGLPVGYAVPGDRIPVQLPFQLQAIPADVVGHYGVQAQVDDGALGNADPQNRIIGLGPAFITPGEAVVSYLPPADWQMKGTSRICFILPDRNQQPDRCAILVYGQTADHSTLVATNHSWYWNQPAWLTMRALSPANGSVVTRGILSYQVAAALPNTPATLTDYRDPDHPVQRQPGEPMVVNVPDAAIFGGGQGAWIAEWQLIIPGAPDQVAENVIAANPLQVIQAGTRFSLDSGEIELTALDPNLGLYAADPNLSKQPTRTTLLRLLIPADYIDAQGQIYARGCNQNAVCDPIPAITSETVLERQKDVNALIHVKGTMLIAIYTGRHTIDITHTLLPSLTKGQTPMGQQATIQTTRWKVVYFFTTVLSSAIQS